MENSNIILNKLTAIESLLEEANQTKPLTIQETAKFLNLSQSHLTSSPVSAKFHTSSQVVRRFILTSLSLYSG